MRQHAYGNRRGFALAMVVFMLFAAAVAGMTGYQIVSDEASLAEGNESTDEALAVASAGMARYVGEHIGIPGSSTYVVGDGSVTVTPKKVAKLNDSTDLYLLSAVGTVTDVRYPTSPATRTVRQYAQLNRRPVKRNAAFMSIQSTIVLTNPNVEVDGTARFAVSAAADCPTGDANGVGNVPSVASAGTTVGGQAPVTPAGSSAFLAMGTVAQVVAAAGVRWSVLKDATFPVPYDGTWPNFAAIASDSFPVVRVTGDYTLDRTGRGVLIVTGTFTDAQAYDWSGIVLAGQAAAGSYSNGAGNGTTVRGIVITGLNGTVFVGNQTLQRYHSLYYPCYVRRANLSLAYLTPVGRSRWDF